jgi:hypothetical protein
MGAQGPKGEPGEPAPAAKAPPGLHKTPQGGKASAAPTGKPGSGGGR